MARWTPADVFGDPESNHACCSCCEDVCPLDDRGQRPPGPGLLVLAGGYISDRYTAVKVDLVDLEGFTPITADLPVALHVPTPAPIAESSATFRPSQVLRLLGLGCEIRQAELAPAPQHIYRDGEHIGWVMPAAPGRGATIKEITALTATVARLSTTSAGRLWDILNRLGGERVDALLDVRHAMTEDVA